MLKNMKISMSHTVRSERTCRLPACFLVFLSGGQLVGRQPFLAACNVLY